MHFRDWFAGSASRRKGTDIEPGPGHLCLTRVRVEGDVGLPPSDTQQPVGEHRKREDLRAQREQRLSRDGIDVVDEQVVLASGSAAVGWGHEAGG